MKNTVISKADKRNSRAVLNTNSNFAYTEAYKSLRTSLTFLADSENCKRIIVTSAIPQEGKSIVSLNLALTIAAAGKKVIIIDCDMRRPSLHHYLKVINSRQGLSAVLSGLAKPEDVIQYHEKQGIYYMTAGVLPPTPSELLASPRMGQLTSLLAQEFDFVILDSPPVSVVTDAAVLSQYVDGTILVVRHRHAPRTKIMEAKRALQAVNARILGVVLNDFDFKKSSKSYDYYHYDYEYDYRSKSKH